VATSRPFVSPSFTYETLEETLDVKPKGAELFIGIPKETSFSPYTRSSKCNGG
jgi:alanine dehydrogenase